MAKATSKTESTTSYLSLQQIEEAADVVEDDVATPEWGGTVRVRGFTKEQEMSIRERAKVGDEIDRERMEMLFLIEGTIEPDLHEDHIPMLRAKSAAACNRILNRIMELSGLSSMARDAAERAFREGPAPKVPSPPGA